MTLTLQIINYIIIVSDNGTDQITALPVLGIETKYILWNLSVFGKFRFLLSCVG